MAEGLATMFGLSEEDATFLEDLDSRCLVRKVDPRTGPWYCYDDVKVTKDEVERVLDIASSNESLIFMPIQDSFGFRPAFAVMGTFSVPGVREKKYLVHIDSKQLPEGYDFKSLTPYFSSEENLKRAEWAGISFRLDEGYYRY